MQRSFKSASVNHPVDMSNTAKCLQVLICSVGIMIILANSILTLSSVSFFPNGPIYKSSDSQVKMCLPEC